MKVYVFQIHTTMSDDEETDRIGITTDFSELCKKFDEEVEELRRCCDSEVEVESPHIDALGEACGRFRVENADDSVTIGCVFDQEIEIKD